MKILSTWTVRTGCLKEAAKRFLAGQGNPPAGVKMVGRWHTSDASRGYAVYESDDLASVAKHALEWTDLCEIHHVPVIEDAEAGAALAELFRK